MEDPELKELAELLLIIVLRSKAPTTAMKYSSEFVCWKNWAILRCGIDYFPAKPFKINLPN